MHNNKELFKEAIAAAKSVREAAIINAKDALEETLTPHLKSMLAAKLQEMEESDEETVDEIQGGEVDVNTKDTTEQTKQLEEELTFEEEEEGLEDEAEVDSEESEDEAEAGEEGELEDELEIEDLTIDDLKDLIRDIVGQEAGEGELEGEPIPGEELPGEEMPADDMMGAEEEEEIDLDELLRELSAMEEGEANEGQFGGEPTGGAAAGLDSIVDGLKALVAKGGPIAAKAIALLQDLGAGAGSAMRNEQEESKEETVEEVKADLKEAVKTVNVLKKQLQEVNLLNAKLLYVNKVFKVNNLNESQKVNIITAFDKAETVKEVKLVYETVSKNVIAKPIRGRKIQEAKLGRASKATGTTAAKPEIISEASDAVRRMQKLAGIIK